MTTVQESHSAASKPTGAEATSARSSFREDLYIPIVIGNGFPPANGPKTGSEPPPKSGPTNPNPTPVTGPRQWPPLPRQVLPAAFELSEAITGSNARLALARLQAGESSVPSDLQAAESDTTATLSQFRALGVDTGKLEAFEAASVARSKSFVGKARDHRTDPAVGVAATRYQAAKSRFLRAAPGADILLPVQTQTFSRRRFPKPHSELGNGPAYRANNEVMQFSTWAEGANWGWGPHDEASNHFYIFWSFVFTPKVTANYKFTGVMWFSGQYLVTADDRWWNSKNASATLACDIAAGPLDGSTGPDLQYEFGVDSVPSGGGDPTTVYHVDKDNIDASGAIQDVEILFYQTSLCDGVIEAGTATLIECIAYGGVDAKGGGSYAGFDFSGTDRGIGCPFLRIDRED